MEIRELMTPEPEACMAQDTLDVVGQMMRRRRCGFIPVVDSQTTKRVIGVLTDRDVALYLTRTNVLAQRAVVETCMTKNPTVIGPDADLTEAAQAMERIAVHRLPVVDHGRLVGVLSLKDSALMARREWSRMGVHIVEQQMRDILEAIAAGQTARSDERGLNREPSDDSTNKGVACL